MLMEIFSMNYEQIVTLELGDSVLLDSVFRETIGTSIVYLKFLAHIFVFHFPID